MRLHCIEMSKPWINELYALFTDAVLIQAKRQFSNELNKHISTYEHSNDKCVENLATNHNNLVESRANEWKLSFRFIVPAREKRVLWILCMNQLDHFNTLTPLRSSKTCLFSSENAGEYKFPPFCFRQNKHYNFNEISNQIYWSFYTEFYINRHVCGCVCVHRNEVNNHKTWIRIKLTTFS